MKYCIGIGLLCASLAVHADINLYRHKYGEINAGLQLQTVGFTGANAYFGNAQAELGNNTNTSWEGSIEPSISAQVNISKSQLYAGFSYLYGITVGHDSSGLTQGLDTPNRGLIEQGYIGWRSGDLFSTQKNLLVVSLGRQDYRLGSGFLIYDGAGDGGTRGAWWIGARQSFDNSALVRINLAGVKLEYFHLNTRPRDVQNKLGLDGVNLEYTHASLGNIGFSYINVGKSQKDLNNDFVDGLHTYDIRANISPFRHLRSLQIAGEYVYQHNPLTQAHGGFAQLSYQYQTWPWRPKFSYRYTALAGDDPHTDKNEAFNALAYGFSDWGTWYQGEITGEHIFGSSNLNSHLLRMELAPIDSVLINLMYYYFELDQATALGNQVTNPHFADEINLIVDWQATDNTLISGALAIAIPAGGAQQFTGGNQTWVQLMLYGSYTF
ncbi:MAG: hypothetical protein GQ581_03920 [Methyloprofundus sp.]|nr:hypothetical protein [Methyloprofundus sp.]